MSHRKRESLPLRNGRLGTGRCVCAPAARRACTRDAEKVAWPGQTLTLRTARVTGASRVRPDRRIAHGRTDGRAGEQGLLRDSLSTEPGRPEEAMRKPEYAGRMQLLSLHILDGRARSSFVLLSSSPVAPFLEFVCFGILISTIPERCAEDIQWNSCVCERSPMRI